MSQDILLLLKPGFQRPEHPDSARFVCPQSNILEGLLAAQPELAARLEIQRVDFPRPRQAVVALLGEDNQGLPALVLAPGSQPPEHARHAGEHVFLQGAEHIAAYLGQQYGSYRLS